MHHAGMLALIAGIMVTVGCSTKNLKEPNYVNIFKPVEKKDIDGKSYEDPRLAPISNLQNAYASYRDGAATNKATLSAVALGGAGVAAIGLATNSHSDLYKSSAAIIATAFGLESWGNFKGQFTVYDGALSYLSCVKTHTKTIIENSNSANFLTTIKEIRSNENKVSAAYSNGVTSAAVKGLGGTPTPKLVNNSEYTLPDGSMSIIPTMKQAIRVSAVADAEVQDITEARKIVTTHRARVETDMRKLQDNVTQAISTSSFDTPKAVAIIAPKLSKPSGTGGETEELLNSNQTIASLEQAHAIIDAYNSYQLCSTGQKND